VAVSIEHDLPALNEDARGIRARRADYAFQRGE
jgi:hypothetical protein